MDSPKMSEQRAVVSVIVCIILATYVFYTLCGEQVSKYMSFVPARDKSREQFNDVLYFSFKESTRRPTTPVPQTDYEFVIAHFNENLDWLKPVANYSHVYDKGHGAGLKPSFSVKDWEELPNVGRESHTYLYHIINNYENLTDITIFLQGKIDDHVHLGLCYPTPLEFLEKAREGIPCIRIGKYNNWGRIAFTGKWKAELDRGIMRPANGTFGQFYQDVFGRVPPQFIDHCWAACFSATKKCLQKYPKEFYQKMISYVDDHPDPEEGHYIERLWRFIAMC